MHWNISVSFGRWQSNSRDRRSINFIGRWLILHGARPVPDWEITRLIMPRQCRLARRIDGRNECPRLKYWSTYLAVTSHFRHRLSDRQGQFDYGHHQTDERSRRSIRQPTIDPTDHSCLEWKRHLQLRGQCSWQWIDRICTMQSVFVRSANKLAQMFWRSSDD